jgi:hypothetical protein
MPTSTREAPERLQAHDLAVKHGLVAADQPTRSSSVRDGIEPFLAKRTLTGRECARHESQGVV